MLTRIWDVGVEGNFREPNLELFREDIGRWIPALIPVPKMTASRVAGSR